MAKTYLDNQNSEFTQMAAIISATGEYFVGDHGKVVEIYSILHPKHCRGKKSDEIIQKADDKNAEIPSYMKWDLMN